MNILLYAANLAWENPERIGISLLTPPIKITTTQRNKRPFSQAALTAESQMLSYKLVKTFILKASLAGTLFAQLAGSSHQLSDIGPEKNPHCHDPLCGHHHEHSHLASTAQQSHWTSAWTARMMWPDQPSKNIVCFGRGFTGSCGKRNIFVEIFKRSYDK